MAGCLPELLQDVRDRDGVDGAALGDGDGADVVDQDVVVDGNLITSRSPGDLSVFCDTIVA